MSDDRRYLPDVDECCLHCGRGYASHGAGTCHPAAIDELERQAWIRPAGPTSGDTRPCSSEYSRDASRSTAAARDASPSARAEPSPGAAALRDASRLQLELL